MDAYATVIRYHECTKHRFEAYARGPETLDWDAQPAPFRRYDGAAVKALPLAAARFEAPFARLQQPVGGPPVKAGPESIGALYHLIPKVFGREQMHSIGLINSHFWLATIGTVLYIASMWVNGIAQGLMWRAINEDGTLTYSFVEALEASHPGFVVRMIGGAIFFTGMLVMAYNTWRTVQAAKPAEYDAAAQIA